MHALMSRHTITDNMTLRRFLFLWRHFHLKEEFEDEEVADMGEDEIEENEEKLLEIDCCAITRIDQEKVDNSEEEEEDNSEGERKTTMVRVCHRNFGLIRYKY
mgnify:CR=1 FL=1